MTRNESELVSQRKREGGPDFVNKPWKVQGWMWPKEPLEWGRASPRISVCFSVRVGSGHTRFIDWLIVQISQSINAKTPMLTSLRSAHLLRSLLAGQCCSVHDRISSPKSTVTWFSLQVALELTTVLDYFRLHTKKGHRRSSVSPSCFLNTVCRSL